MAVDKHILDDLARFRVVDLVLLYALYTVKMSSCHHENRVDTTHAALEARIAELKKRPSRLLQSVWFSFSRKQVLSFCNQSTIARCYRPLWLRQYPW